MEVFVVGLVLAIMIAGVRWALRWNSMRRSRAAFESINRSLVESNRERIQAHQEMQFREEFNQDITLAQETAKANGCDLSDEDATRLMNAAYKTMESLSLVNDEMTRVFGPQWLEKGQAEQHSDFEPVDEGSTNYHSYWHITDIREGSESYGLPLLVRFYASNGDIENAHITSAVVPRLKRPHEI